MTTTRRNFVAGAATAGIAAAFSVGAAHAKEGVDASYMDDPTAHAADDPTYSGGIHQGEVSTIKVDVNGIASMDDWLGQAPTFADGDIDQELEADVIVVGAGVAGVAAARTLAEGGAKVIVFERCSEPQTRSGEYAVIGSQIMADNWGRSNLGIKNEVLDELMRQSGCRSNMNLLRDWADNVGEAFDWYCGAVEDLTLLPTSTSIPPEGVENWLQPRWLPAPADSDVSQQLIKTFYTCTVQFTPSQKFVFDANVQKMQDTGNVELYVDTPVKTLLRDGDGPVTGVVAQNFDGTTYRAKAKAVILTAGDYCSDPNMFSYYNPELNGRNIKWTSYDQEGKAVNDGSGDRLGLWVGGKMDPTPHAVQHHNEGGVLGTTPFLFVDFHGHRFMNEDVPAQELDNRMTTLYKQGCYCLFDAGWVDQVSNFCPRHVQVTQIVDDETANGNPWMTPWFGYATTHEVEDSVESGQTIKADTIEELIDQLELDDDAKKAALESVERYNELAKAGFDKDYGKVAKHMFPIENPPFYASKFGLVAAIVSENGLVIDDTYHVLDTEDERIENLYSAGNNSGGRFYVHYPVTCPGISHSSVLSQGRCAGRSILRDLGLLSD